MSDIAHDATRPSVDRASWPSVRLLAPYACIFVAGTAGLVVGRTMGGDAAAYETSLLVLLRFMAAMKFAGVVGAVGLLHWRFAQPIASRYAVAYVTALAAMASATGLIWSLGGIAIGALIFHAGLIAFLILAWRDDGARLSRRNH